MIRSLSEFPNEVLVRIATLLDSETLVAFARAHHRFHDVSIHAIPHIKVKNPTETVSEYLVEKEPLIRRLDLSGCQISSSLLDLIPLCYNLRELNLVDSRIHPSSLSQTLRHLSELEVLKVTMHPLVNSPEVAFVDSGPFKNLKKLFVEAPLTPLACGTILTFLNSCHAIEMVHVNFVGDYYQMWSRSQLPDLEAGRWVTLHTVICNFIDLHTEPYLIREFLRAIFAHKGSAECRIWIEEAKRCYVYERGILNSTHRRSALDQESLEKLVHLRLFQEHGDESGFHLTWGHPLSLATHSYRISFCFGTFLQCLSLQLKELDLSGFHFGPKMRYTEEQRLAVFDLSPNLTILVVNMCFCEEWTNLGLRSDFVERMTRALEESNLKKLYLGLPADSFNRHTIIKCDCCHSRWFSSAALVTVSGNNPLEELNIHCYTFPDAFEGMGGPNLRTIRLGRINEDSTSLHGFLQRSPNLENLMLDVPASPSHVALRSMMEAIASCKNLRNLCLKVSPEPHGRVTAGIVKMIPELPDGIQAIHVHIWDDNGEEFVTAVTRAVQERSRSLGREIYLSTKCSIGLLDTMGNSLCYSGSPVGHVRATNW